MVTRSQNMIFKPKHLFLATKSPPIELVEPTCVSQALKDPNWRKAMSDEFTALVRQGTWDLVPPSPGQNVIGCKWVFRLKRRADGSIEPYKARLIAKGYHQQPGLDYSETFSPVIKLVTLRTVLSIAVSNHWPIRQLDINNAFLNGNLDEELFMHQLVGFIDETFPHHICCLKKSLYGLKQAPRAWFRELKAYLLSQGLQCSRSDTSLFILRQSDIIVYFLVYVDDILITGNSLPFIDKLILNLGARFSLKDLGKLHLFLGIEAIHTPAGLFLTQHRYITEILHRASMSEAKAVAFPMASSCSLQQGPSNTLTDPTVYRQIVGALQYLSLTRPDISFSVNHLSQFLHCPTEYHWQAVKRVLRYLQGSLHRGLLLTPQTSLSLHGFSDSDWARDRDSYISTTGYIIFLGLNSISWKATKQRAVARNSTEVEYRALAAASSEMVWVKNLLTELGVSCFGSPTLYCDNLGATYLSSNPIMHSRMKHIAIDLHFVRELVDKQVLRVAHISSKDQLVDGFTKPLPTARFLQLRSKIGVADGSSILRGHVKESAT
ncbi:hypothetical protein SLA2020_314700 [Shorea laevis]